MEKEDTKTVDNKAVDNKAVQTEDESVAKALKRIEKEIWYNRIVMGIFFVILLGYIQLKTDNIGNILGTFIEMFMS